MCGRYVITRSTEELVEHFDIDRAEIHSTEAAPAPSHNVTPGTERAVLRRGGEQRRLELLHWGFPRGDGGLVINVRSEDLDQHPAFAAGLAERRCVVPADGFYEWRRGAGQKAPYYFYRPDGAPLAMAAIWSRWRSTGSGGDRPRGAYSIFTCAANETLRDVHHRMPVLLESRDYAAWLDPGAEPDRLRSLLVPAAERVLTRHPVSSFVNSALHDGPECVRRVAEPARQLGLF